MATEIAAPTAERVAELPLAAYNEALAKAKEGRLEEARRQLLLTLQLEPDLVPALTLMAKLEAQAGDYASAVQRWDHALTLQPDHAGAQAGRTRALQLLQAERLRQRLILLAAVAVAAALVIVGIYLPLASARLSALSPARAESAVRAALAASPELAPLGLTVGVTRGTCRITGAVPTNAHRDLAAATVRKAFAGPLDMAAVAVGTPSPAQAVAALCQTGSCEWMRGIKVTTTGNRLILAGLVPTAADRDWLVSLAGCMVGQKQVDGNGLIVLSPVRLRFSRHDTLWGLADRYYGDGCRWREIRDANPRLPRNPQRIPRGGAGADYAGPLRFHPRVPDESSRGRCGSPEDSRKGRSGKRPFAMKQLAVMTCLWLMWSCGA